MEAVSEFSPSSRVSCLEVAGGGAGVVAGGGGGGGRPLMPSIFTTCSSNLRITGNEFEEFVNP